MMNDSADVTKHMERLERLKAKHENGNGAGMPLAIAAKLAGWPTPNLCERGPEARSTKLARGSGGVDLQTAAKLAGWSTPTTRDHKGIDQNYHDGAINNSLPNQVAALGTTTSSSHAATAKRGALNSGLSRWLMGYPAEWLSCVDWATRSSRRSRRRS